MNEYLKLSEIDDEENLAEPALSESGKQEIETQIRAHISNRMLHAAELKTWYESQRHTGQLNSDHFWMAFKEFNPMMAEQFRIFLSMGVDKTPKPDFNDPKVRSRIIDQPKANKSG